MYSKIKYKQLVGYLYCYSTLEIIYRTGEVGGGSAIFIFFLFETDHPSKDLVPNGQYYQ